MSARSNYTVRLTDAEAEQIKTEAARCGVSVAEHIRRAALNGPTASVQPSVGALDTAALDAVTQRFAELIGRGETDATAARATAQQFGEQVKLLSQIGLGLRKIEDHLARGHALPLPTKPAAGASAQGARSV